MEDKKSKESSFNKIGSSEKKNESQLDKESHPKKLDKETKIGNYLIKKTLGKGTFAIVKLAIYIPKMEQVAIKIIEKKKLKEEDDIIRLKREFEMLTQFNHPNVISVSEIFESKEAYFTVMEYCEGGELFNYIVLNKILSEEKSAFFYFQLINGLEYIHSLGIVHRDLKPENLLLTSDYILKISDFGLSNYFNPKDHKLLETPCGSPCYASPEMLSGDNYDGFKIDIWASGIILFAMLCGYLPFDHINNNKLFKKILECKITYPKHLSKESKDLIKKILVPNPSERITIDEIKKHPFYLKGKKIFNSNFTIYQEIQSSSSDLDEDLYIDESISKNYNQLWYDFIHKSQILLINYPGFSEKDIFDNNLKHESFEKIEMPQLKIKKFMKKILKKDKINKQNYYNQKEKNIFPFENISGKSREFLTYNNSINYLIKDISELFKKIINKYKLEEKTKIKNKFDKHKSLQNKKECNNIIITDINEQIKKTSNSNDFVAYDKEIKEKKNNLKSLNIRDYKKKILIETSRKQINDNYNEFIKEKMNYKKNKNNKKVKIINNNIKFNTRITNPFKKNNDLFIKHKKIRKINKLPINVKFKYNNLKTKRTNLNKEKIDKLKKFLEIINQQTFKPNINIINKQNIIHHFTTNITNYTKKNYYSNIIINDSKNGGDNKRSSTSQQQIKRNNINKKNDKILLKEYLKRIKLDSVDNILLKNKEKKLKRDNINKSSIDNKYKNINKHNTNNTNIINFVSPRSFEGKQIGESVGVRRKKSNNLSKDVKIKIYANTFYNNKKDIKNKNINNERFILYNNIKHLNPNKRKDFTKSKDDLTFEISYRNYNPFDMTNLQEKTNEYLNSFIYINNSAEKTNNRFNLFKIMRPKLSQQLNKINKLNNFTIDNNIFYNTDRKGNFNNIIKKVEYLNKTHLFKKKNINNHSKRFFLKKQLIIDNIPKKENKNQNYQPQIQTQRNKPTKFIKVQQDKKDRNYLKTNRNNEINNGNNNTKSNHLDKNNIAHIKSSQLISSVMNKINANKINYKNLRNINHLVNINYKSNQSQLNKNNLFNMTSDNINVNIGLKLKNISNKVHKDNLHNTYFKIIDDVEKNDQKERYNANYTLTNNKFYDISRFMEKKNDINKNKVIYNNTYTNNTNKAKTNFKYSLLTNNNSKNSNAKKNTKIFDKYLKQKQIMGNNKSIPIKNLDNNIYNGKTLIGMKSNFKFENNINNKSMTLQKLKNKFIQIKLKDNNYNILNTEVNLKEKENTINTSNNYENINNKKMIKLKTYNINPKRKKFINH